MTQGVTGTVPDDLLGVIKRLARAGTVSGTDLAVFMKYISRDEARRLRSKQDMRRKRGESYPLTVRRLGPHSAAET